jgi:hypothetical protein
MRLFPPVLFVLASCVPLTFHSGAVSNPGDTPAAAAPVATPAAPKPITSTLDVWIVDRIDGITAAKLDRAEDLIAFFQQVDPKLMVHTIAVTKQWKYCPHAFTEDRLCFDIDPSAKQGETRDELAQPNDLAFPRFGAALWWHSLDEKTDVGSGVTAGALAPLAANTPGFILWGHALANTGPDRPVYFLSLDGGVYQVPLSALALGPPATGSWPAKVQHSLYAIENLTGAYADDVSGSMSAALKADFEARERELTACSHAAWKPSQAEFDANDAANITQITRNNRELQIEARYRKIGEARCAQAFRAVGGVYSKMLEQRLADREKIYAAAKRRFLQ